VSGALSRGLAVAGLISLAVLVLLLPGAAALLAAAPLLALTAAALAGWRRWAIAAAVTMLPYFSYGVMTTIADADGRGRGLLFSLLAIAIVLAAFDSAKRR
jgi:hypothetical protein